MNRVRLPDDVPIEAGMVTKAIRSAQTQVEQQNFEIRKNVLKYDEVLNKQRTVIYAERRRVLAGENIGEQIEHMLADVIGAYVDGETGEGYAEDWDLDKLWTAIGTLYPIGIRWADVAEDQDELTREALTEAVLADARAAYARREAEIDEVIGTQGGMRELERQVLLQVMDRKWREHLYEMDYLKEGIGLRAMAQRDPLIEYQREGFDMFSAMLEGIKEETVGHLFTVRVQAAEPAPPAAAPAAQATAPAPAAAQPVEPVEPVTDPRMPRTPATAPARTSGRHASPDPEPAPANVLPPAFRGARPADLSYSGPAEDGSAVRSRSTRAAREGRGGDGRVGDGTVVGGRPSRNRPCPCGSGRKYKQCHGSPTAARP
jgi:preprotein translocase subunit SecA